MIQQKIHLGRIAHARSGDKGSSANIGVIAYTKEGYDFLQKILTAVAVNTYLIPLGVKKTVRYDLPNLLAFNFVLKGILNGGGSRSLRADAQGKALGQALLEMELMVPVGLLETLEKVAT
jgi:hypothetical protein